MEELERTYLAKELPPDLEKSTSKDMLDIYIPATANHPHLRIRHRGDTYEITNKQPMHGSDASRSVEHTIVLTREEFEELHQLPGKRVYKKRYYYSADGLEYEIDVFQKNLEGLVLVDIEFASVEEKDSFTPPSFCLKEVTQEKFIAGGMLCGKSYTDIEEKLNSFGYKKLLMQR